MELSLLACRSTAARGRCRLQSHEVSCQELLSQEEVVLKRVLLLTLEAPEGGVLPGHINTATEGSRIPFPSVTYIIDHYTDHSSEITREVRSSVSTITVYEL